MSALDAAVRNAVPLEGAPHGAAMPVLAAGRKRLVCAADGLYLEARTPALHVRTRIAEATTPYGPVGGLLQPCAGPVPMALVAQFVAAAQASPRTEIAGLIELTGQGHALRLLDSISSGAGHVSYADRDIDDDGLVIDLHSHGVFPARFSAQDDESDLSRRGPYIAMVVGRCDTARPEIVTRLVLPPHLIPLTLADLTAIGALA